MASQGFRVWGFGVEGLGLRTFGCSRIKGQTGLL